ncbi:MAG TPA: hypothetical protein VFE37_25335 [Chloroflexota bacterium]|nr:hypothetical protein [Chloroflexota bacterium]
MEVLSQRGRWWLLGAVLGLILLSQVPAWPTRLEALAVGVMFALGLVGAYVLPRPCPQAASRRRPRA